MSKTLRGAGAQRQPATPTEAMEILASTLLLCQQAGLKVASGNIKGKLVIAIPDVQQIGDRFVVAVAPAPAADVGAPTSA